MKMEDKPPYEILILMSSGLSKF